MGTEINVLSLSSLRQRLEFYCTASSRIMAWTSAAFVQNSSDYWVLQTSIASLFQRFLKNFLSKSPRYVHLSLSLLFFQRYDERNSSKSEEVHQHIRKHLLPRRRPTRATHAAEQHQRRWGGEGRWQSNTGLRQSK